MPKDSYTDVRCSEFHEICLNEYTIYHKNLKMLKL